MLYIVISITKKYFNLLKMLISYLLTMYVLLFYFLLAISPFLFVHLFYLEQIKLQDQLAYHILWLLQPPLADQILLQFHSLLPWMTWQTLQSGFHRGPIKILYLSFKTIFNSWAKTKNMINQFNQWYETYQSFSICDTRWIIGKDVNTMIWATSSYVSVWKNR